MVGTQGSSRVSGALGSQSVGCETYEYVRGELTSTQELALIVSTILINSINSLLLPYVPSWVWGFTLSQLGLAR